MTSPEIPPRGPEVPMPGDPVPSGPGAPAAPAQPGYKVFLLSLLELALVTWGTTFLGTLAATGFDLLDLGAWKAAALSALPAAFAVVYGAFVKYVGNSRSALAVDTRPRVR